jgi:hypothetical protein
VYNREIVAPMQVGNGVRTTYAVESRYRNTAQSGGDR